MREGLLREATASISADRTLSVIHELKLDRLAMPARTQPSAVSRAQMPSLTNWWSSTTRARIITLLRVGEGRGGVLLRHSPRNLGRLWDQSPHAAHPPTYIVLQPHVAVNGVFPTFLNAANRGTSIADGMCVQAAIDDIPGRGSRRAWKRQ